MTDPAQEKRKLLDLIGSLFHVKRRPNLYLSDSPSMSFWRGFYVACNTFGLDMSYDPRVAQERGWAEGGKLEQQMKDRGMDETAIMDEFLSLVIDSVARRYNLPKSDLERIDRSLRDPGQQ